MSEDYQKKLKDYYNGTLSDTEREQMEADLERLEAYQTLISQQLEEDNALPVKLERASQSIGSGAVRKGKWKARFHNALTALGIFILAAIVSGLITSAFFTLGRPNRLENYRSVVDAAIAVTHPNLRLRSTGMGVNSFFTMDLKGTLEKRVGTADKRQAEFSLKFLFSMPSLRQTDLNTHAFHFAYPTADAVQEPGDWHILEQLGEGTVAEAYLSFDRLYEIDEILSNFRELELGLVWFAADTGFDHPDFPDYWPIGFPYMPIWQVDDMRTIERTVERISPFSRTIEETIEMPRVDAYGDGALREENFLKTLELLRRYENIARRASAYTLKAQERIDYLEENGVHIYGMVVTGPTKELLKLQEKAWIARIVVGEVDFWNWHP